MRNYKSRLHRLRHTRVRRARRASLISALLCLIVAAGGIGLATLVPDNKAAPKIGLVDGTFTMGTASTPYPDPGGGWGGGCQPGWTGCGGDPGGGDGGGSTTPQPNPGGGGGPSPSPTYPCTWEGDNHARSVRAPISTATVKVTAYVRWCWQGFHFVSIERTYRTTITIANNNNLTVTASLPNGDGEPIKEPAEGVAADYVGHFAVQVLITTKSDTIPGVPEATCTVQIDRDYLVGGGLDNHDTSNCTDGFI